MLSLLSPVRPLAAVLTFSLSLLAAAFVCAPTAQAADNAVLTWNTEVLNAVRLARNPPPVAALHLATFHAALHDAVNGITGRFEPFLVNDRAPAGADVNAAIAGAAHTVLKALWGNTSNPRNLDVALERALADIPAGPARDAGLDWGRKVAKAVLADRETSGWNKPLDGVFSSREPGKWRETPTGFRPCVLPQLSVTRPFALTSPSQFRPVPPPSLDSKEYADELAFVRRVGARDNAERTEDQTLTTVFWSDDLGTATPAGHWNVIAQDLVRSEKLDTADTARLFALLNVASADAGIACWDAKMHYRLWRPESAIRELTTALNPHFTPDPDFFPNMESPAHPDYTSGHSTFSGAATRILERFFGRDDLSFTTISDGLPGAVRSFKSLSQARDEIGMSRVYGGIHTMSANLAGQKAGIALADFIFDSRFRPAKR
ncbi:phosphatase PAP2 family protein [Nibricoccus sp. IMCC34717]|uniref:vanadium-dependent haloperoxidase n=1 Tax=Nibricoccus sp. IMCC34717 TaxID=3034021 RepID=UPI00384C2B35